jgi:hypothetical protein
MLTCLKPKFSITDEGLMISEIRMDRYRIDELLLYCLRVFRKK